ncbi:superoxide dismutase, Ni [Psychrobacter sp. I-STPA6b]|uniref:superoxide dismutase, Ni n=1 Tax=Psychrobacter sp. I-STPA6b TaxID=2585718 RepID=UPI001D0C637F|nr:superoxide dismutase, Ni [Psychrobacter sp. I-STPA6b]
MLHSLLQKFDTARPFSTVSAHCDIPCGIYDSTPAQIFALSVLRYCHQIDGLGDSKEDQAKLVRLVADKEKHAESVKHEIRVIWGDYFKGELLEKYPNIHELTHSIMMAGSAAKQSVSVEKAQKLVDLVNEFAEIFWETKGVETYRATCPYEPKVETVYPKLG